MATKERLVSAQYVEFLTQVEVGGKQRARRVHASRGSTIEVDAEQEARMDAHGSLAPEGADVAQMETEREARLDVYRAQRGDTDAFANVQGAAAARTGTLERVDLNVAAASIAELADFIREEKPTVDETVALAKDNPELASKLLDAEHTVTGGEPRQGVESALTKVIEKKG